MSAVACKYDDGELWNKVNSLDDRLTSIETQLSQMNSDISSLSTVVNALQNKVYVASVDEVENGYQITFTDGKKVAITNGKDGADAPVISVDEYEGKYYWVQIIGEAKSWLTDKNGAKIPVTGDDGITPILKVNTEGYWVISYDRGITFALLLDETNNPVKAVGKDGSDGKDGVNGSNGSDGDSFFNDVRVENGELVLVLADGTELKLPLENSNETDVARVSGTVALANVDNLKIETIYENLSLTSSSFSVKAPIDDYPQTIYLTDDNNNVIMLYRDFYSSEKSIIIDENSTALALVTMNPVLAPIGKEHFSELIDMIKGMPHYSTLVDEVKKSIEGQKDLLSEDNTALLLALSNVMEDLCGNHESDVVTMSRSVITNWEQLNIENPYPFVIEINGSRMTIKNTALSPMYDGTVKHPTIGEKDFDIPTVVGGYGVWGLLKQTAYGWSGGSVGDLGYSDPRNFYFTEEGEYRFHFSRTTAQAQRNFWLNILYDVLLEAVPVASAFNESDEILNLCMTVLDIYDLETQIVNTDPLSVVQDIASLTITYLKSNEFKSLVAGEAFYKKFSNAESILTNAGRAFKYLSIIKGGCNTVLRIGWRMKAPKEIDFCLCYYDGDVSSCSTVELVKKESTDNQEGYAGQALLEPLEVFVKAHSEDGTLVETAYQKVKFEVVSGGGSLSEDIVGTEGSYFTGTYWTLGDGGEQKVKAVAIDMVTGQEISEPVYFTATLKEQADITVRLSWAKESGATDIDLHVTDPFGEEIYYHHMSSASGGWLDRDDLVGPGPEHISWTQAPNGAYLIQVHYYGSDGHAITTYNVTVHAGEETFGPFVGSIAYHQTVTIGVLNMPDATMVRSSSIPTFVEMMEIDETPETYPKKK